ncbi:PD-(D/E)XK nuclease family protein [uncultured Porphyromonas sp.]|uniref:PD-(D/E)XK nuclease family protein n=1 Tax=uncultured Porphyromonas sp. TaxID=159274 RepID=UPI002592F2ED|nr:PD-(D/E)XK nuclease family protein [uncultured Porphyromonas sp.]
MSHTSYLRGLAQHFFRIEGKQLYKYRFFFPNKRSGHFFLHYLRQVAGDEPLLLPEVTTLGAFLRRAVHLPEENVNNELLLIYHLYTSYKLVYKESEYSFENFYEIGKQLLADFNDIDNHLADALSIFENMDLLDELTIPAKDLLNQDQIDALKKYAPNFEKNLDKGYTAFWQYVPEIYTQFKETLRGEGLVYNGMLMRDITQRLENGELKLFKEPKVNVFIGLNALSQSEQRILKHFKENSETLFYWDYDSYLVQQKFTDKNRKVRDSLFPEPTDDKLAYTRDKNSRHQPQLHIISIPSKLGQANYIAQKIIPQLQTDELINLRDPNTAIILPDESQLTNLLSNLQDSEVGEAPLKLNITMGFPIKYLPIIAKLLHLLNLQRLAYGRRKNGMPIWRREELIDLFGLELDQGTFDTTKLLNPKTSKKLYFTEEELSQAIEKEHHQDLRLLFNLDRSEQGDLLHNTLTLLTHLQEKFSDDATIKMALTVVEELLLEIKGSLDRFVTAHETARNQLTLPLLHDLIHTTISQARIPFSGEPLEGVQVMGILEARSIDFENIIVMDAGEGLLPAKSRKYGLIPQNIRYEKGLPTYKWQDAIRAYNFFHMIGRSERLYALYDSRKTARASGEPSRYLTLLTHIYGVPAKRYNAYFPLFPIPSKELQPDLQKIQAYRAQLTSKEPQSKYGLSPSALINYLTCPRKFYYQNILGLRDPDELTDVLEKNDVGTITHKALEILYNGFNGTVVTKEHLKGILDKPDLITNAVREAYYKAYQTDETQFNGYFEMYKDLIFQDVQNTIQLDINKNAPFTYCGGEQTISTLYSYGQNGESIHLRGTIDRIDIKQGKIRLVDYKTGSDKLEFNLERSFDPENSNIDRAAIQLLTYCVMYLEAYGKKAVKDIAPMLIKVRDADQGWFVHNIDKTKNETIDSFSLIETGFKEQLNEALRRIAETDDEFIPNNRKNSCNYCAGRELCNKAKLFPNR